MDILNPGNLNYWEQILKNKEDIESLKKNSNMFTYVVGHATSIDNMPFDSDNNEINKNDFRGYIINRVIDDVNPNYTLNVSYNSQNYETDMFIFFGTENGLYLICFPIYNNESILYLGKWNGFTYEYCNQITQDLADSIQELTETLSNYQTKLNFDETPTLGSNNPVTSDGIKKAIAANQVPSGGTIGQVLTKNNEGYGWANIPKDNDYVVEQGTSNGWIYRKWNSGVAECFRYVEQAQTGALEAWGSVYNSANLFGGFTYPFPFIKEPYCNIEASSTTGGGWFHYDETGTFNVTPKWKWIRPTKLDNITINYRLYAIGQWK